MSDTPRTDATLAAFLSGVNRKDSEVAAETFLDFARALERELAAVTAKRDALRKDAERYRWLRERERKYRCTWHGVQVRIFESYWNEYFGEDLDARIDGAMPVAVTAAAAQKP